MSFCSVPPVSRRCGGVALVLVLAFVVLLTGLIIAFFSRALSERQISDSSANGVRVDVFAAGAVNTVVGDFRQEIAAGSNATFFTDASGNVVGQVFQPFSTNTAAPAQALKGSASEQSGISFSNPTAPPYAPNLVKRSAYTQNFFPAGPDPGSNSYNSGNTSQTVPLLSTGPAPTPLSAPSYPPSSRAANVASTVPSQNGRSISLARWNKGLLLPKANPASETDFRPISLANPPVGTASYPAPPAGTNEFVAPDWIVSARDGTNPTAWNKSLAVTGTNPAIGRFAYNVYNEGGLLDANAAGFPATASGGVPLSNSTANLPAYKGSLAFADLKQLRGIADLPPTRQEEVVRTLLGWRNYASTGIDPTSGTPTLGAPVTGSINVPPGYRWSGPGAGTNIYNFFNLAQTNGTGFLRTANPLLVNGQSDRLFGSRQQLLALLLQSVADQSASTAATAERANLQNAMQYLGTFSRSLNQPSYVPPPGRPKVVALASGGNSEGRNNDDEINPAFLSVRVKTSVAGGPTQGRSDGSDLIVGEPLLKKRFPLSRLAWLTYKGPSKGKTGTDIDDLKTNFGYTQAFLDQGDSSTIQKYFGLTWNAGGYWSYNVHAATNSSTGIIMTLKQVRDSNREPDFIELLKAAITAGALGKSSTQPPSPTDGSPPAIQFNRDSSIDFQVIQLAANIIDQFDVDGYPTRIQFFGREFRGVENLPYFYRTRNALYRVANPVPMPADTNADMYTLPTGATMLPNNRGAFIMVHQPEIWNPHAYVFDVNNAAVINRSLGNPRPTKLQLVVYGSGPSLPTPQTGGANTVFPRWRGNNIGNGSLGSGLSSNTTAMTFVNEPSLYREPTLLIKPGVPAGSLLAAPGFVQSAINDGLSASGGGIAVLDSAAQAYTLNSGAEPEPRGIYCGIYLGKNVVAVPTTDQNGVTTVKIAGQANFSSPSSLTYQVQCESANVAGAMDAYDEKYFSPEPFTDGLPYQRGMLAVSATDPNTYSGRLIVGLSRLMTGFDPRTSRFNVMASSTGDDTFFEEREFTIPGLRSPGATKWLSRKNNVVPTNRQDASAGFGMGGMGSTAPVTAMGWTWDNNNGRDNEMLRLGLFSQNNPKILDDLLRFTGDGTSRKGTTAAQYYADADGVVRRAMGAYVGPTTASVRTTGLPMATAYIYQPTDSTQSVDPRQSESRPIILNRPFRSVAELGYVFSDTPWKNTDFSTKESGYAPLLDVFSVNDTDDATGLVAGKVDLNTRQTPVLQAILTGAYKDENNGPSRPLSAAEAQTLAGKLYSRTTSTASTQGPLSSLADVVGGWKSGSGTSAVYDGYSADLDNPDPARSAATNPDLYNNNIPRYRESAVRALSAVGNARVWSLMIDLVAQTGRYPQSASGLNNFVVEGEQRYWVHVAIDRYTGQVIDKQIEVVKE